MENIKKVRGTRTKKSVTSLYTPDDVRSALTALGLTHEELSNYFQVELLSDGLHIREHREYANPNKPAPKAIEHGVIAAESWKVARPAVQRAFAEALKLTSKQVAVLTPTDIGSALLPRMLGRELLVLYWALAQAAPEEIHTIVANWLSTDQPTRWWLYTLGNSTQGNAPTRGWRAAVYFGLSNSERTTSK